MQVQQLKQLYFNFFIDQGHKLIPSASLLPINDPTALFTTAGMQPLVPNLLGEKHEHGTRLVNVQKCLRTNDIESVGDDTHLTFFEMLGNWSLGDYFKQDSIAWSYEFLTAKKYLNINPDKLYISCFAGDKDIPKDEESAKIWQSVGIAKEKIFFLGRGDNFWGPVGESGPCGPDTEIFYWTGDELPKPEATPNTDPRFVEIWNNVFMEYFQTKRTLLVDGMGTLYDENFQLNEALLSILDNIKTRKILVINAHGDKAKEILADHDIEIFTFENKVKKDNPEFFSQLLKQFGLDPSDIFYLDHAQENLSGAEQAGIKFVHPFKNSNETLAEKFIGAHLIYYKPLKQKNVDTGMGVERTAAILGNKKSVYEIDHFVELLDLIKHNSKKENKLAERIIADHLRAATFLLADPAGLEPSNKDQGYILRRLLRRAIRQAKSIDFDLNKLSEIARLVIRQYHRDHPELLSNADRVIEQIDKEKVKFLKTLDKGLKEFEKIQSQLTSGQTVDLGAIAFDLFQSYGFPLEMFTEELSTRNIPFTNKQIKQGFDQEQKQHQDKSRTAAVGKFKGGLADHDAKTTQYHTTNHMMLQAMRQVLGNHIEQRGSNITAERLRFDFSHPEKLTGEQIKAIEDIVNAEIAKALPVHFEEMTVAEAKKAGATGVFEHKYGDKVKVYFVGDFSKEICGGPHVQNTKEITGKLKIIKEESVSAGIRRIKAVLQ